jgi:hypothetical protein
MRMPRCGARLAGLLGICLAVGSLRVPAQVVQRGVGDDPASRDTAGLAASRFHALLIAVQDYADSRVTSLQSPVRDAESLRKVLVERYRFDDVKLLKNAKRKDILNAFERLTAGLDSNDNLLIFYAGHGNWDDVAKQGYWLPADAERMQRTEWISSDDINAMLRRMRARHILLIADACFAGAALMRGDEDKAMERLYRMPSRKAMTSGSNEAVPDKSKFLEYVVKRLEANTDPYLPAGTLFERLRIAVMNNSETTPLFLPIHNTNDQGGEFLFPLRKPGSAQMADVDVLVDTSSDIRGTANPGRLKSTTTPRGAVEASIGDFVELINKKNVQDLGSRYETMHNKPEEWKEKLMRFIREDLVSAKLVSQEITFEGAEEGIAVSDVVISVVYNDPVIPTKHQGKLHFLVTHRRFGGDWSLRTFSLVDKPPY